MSDESHPLVQLPGSERAPLATAAPAASWTRPNGPR